MQNHFNWGHVYSLLRAGYGTADLFLTSAESAPDPDSEEGRIWGPCLVTYEESADGVTAHVEARDL